MSEKVHNQKTSNFVPNKMKYDEQKFYKIVHQSKTHKTEPFQNKLNQPSQRINRLMGHLKNDSKINYGYYE